METKFFFKTAGMAFAILMMCFSLKAQTQTAPLVEWANDYVIGPSGSSNWMLDIKATSDKAYITAGYSTTSGTGTTNRYPVLMKLNGKGEMVWNQWFTTGAWIGGGTFWEVVEGSNCYVAVGYVVDASGYKKPFIVQTDLNGNITNGPYMMDEIGTYGANSLRMYGLTYDHINNVYVSVGQNETTNQIMVQEYSSALTMIAETAFVNSSNYPEMLARSVCCIYNSGGLAVLGYALTGAALTSSIYSTNNIADAYVCTFTISSGTIFQKNQEYYDFGNSPTHTPGTPLVYCSWSGVGGAPINHYIGSVYGPSYDLGTKIFQISNGGNIIVGTSANYYYGGKTDWSSVPMGIDNWVDGDGAVLQLSYNSSLVLSVVNLSTDGGSYSAVRLGHFSGQDLTITTRLDPKDNTLVMSGSMGDESRPSDYTSEEGSGAIIKADLNANVIWFRYVKDPWTGLCCYSNCVDADGNYVTVGTHTSTSGDNHYAIKLQDEANFDCRQNFNDWTFENGIVLNTGNNISWKPTDAIPYFKDGQADISIKGTIEIKPGTSLTITNMTLEFADPRDYVDVDDPTAYSGYIPGILVDPGASLKLVGCTLKPLSSFSLMGNNGGSGCTPGLWDGIELLGNVGQLQQSAVNIPPLPADKQGAIEMDNSTLIGARIGITVGDGWAQDGGLVRANPPGSGGGTTIFKDCYRAVAYYGYPNPNHSYFANCTFIWDQPLPQTGNWGFNTLFSMDGVTGIGFDGCTFANTVLPGTINGHSRGTGIGALDAVFNFPSAALSTYEVPGITGCYSYAPPPPSNYFYGLDNGVISEQGTGSPNVNIAYCWFYNCVDAIFLDHNTNPQVIENEIFYDNEINLSSTGHVYTALNPITPLESLINVVSPGGWGNSTGGINNVYDYIAPDANSIGYGITIGNEYPANFYATQNHIHYYLTDNSTYSQQTLVPGVNHINNGKIYGIYMPNDIADHWQPLVWENTVDNHLIPYTAANGDANTGGFWFAGTTTEINVADNIFTELNLDWHITSSSFTISIDPSLSRDGFNQFSSTAYVNTNIDNSSTGTFAYNYEFPYYYPYYPYYPVHYSGAVSPPSNNSWNDYWNYATGTLGYSIECGSTLPTGPDPTLIQQNSSANISISPNPMMNQANISWQLPENYNEATLTVYDNLGRLCKTLSLSGNAGESQIMADNLTGGMYIYRLTGDGNELKQGKFIVTRH